MIDDLTIQRVSRGDRAAFQTLHEELHGRLFYYAFKLTRDRMTSEDILQEAFVKYWTRRETFTSLLAVKIYLFSFLKNKIMSRARDENNRKRILDGMDREEIDTSEEYLLITAEICGQVRQAIGELPDRTRQVIEMGMTGMTVDEIAAGMNVSPNTVKTLKKAGYQALRGKLKHLKTFLPFLFLP
ncbi:MAG: sigma-70 family RNA polymerase sigma factor [Odoribacteraceae bacterium]|jgi:RNA polymerase sigma-70 factor (ECF subfamily)|nr:sigma-70 family RNA polymerase sigma factor [Odoribacteraceae bacterium]